MDDQVRSYDVLAEDLEYGRAGDVPLIARLYRPRGVTGFASVVNVHRSEEHTSELQSLV